jgi:hypothetical protein
MVRVSKLPIIIVLMQSIVTLAAITPAAAIQIIFLEMESAIRLALIL